MRKPTLLLEALARDGRFEVSAPKSKPASLARCSSTSGSGLAACRVEARLLGADAGKSPVNDEKLAK